MSTQMRLVRAMFVCRACSQRLRGLPGITSPALPAFHDGPARTRAQLPPLPKARRWSTTATAPEVGIRAPTKEPSDTMFDRTSDTPPDMPPDKASPKATLARIDTLAKQRLRFLKDPYTIGKHVEDVLARDRPDGYEEALAITRMASKRQQVVVSWNHLLAYLLRKERLMPAMKLFNEMKKRAQLPNAQTYTIIFKGCANSAHASLAVFQATRLYYSMLDKERIKPNTIHMNAVLQVCARAKDIDSLFSVVKTANGHLRAPSNLTYTTVLNALRFATAQPHHRTVKDGEEEVHVDKEKVSVTISRSRAVWEEVVDSWRQGRILIDEELVCAMGRVLLMGETRDSDDVLALVEQTMGIPRLDRQAALKAPDKAVASGAQVDTPKVDTPKADTPKVDTPKADTPKAVRTSKTQFVPLPEGTIGSWSKNEDSRQILYAQPGRNVLSLVLTSLGATRKTSLAPRYWDLLCGAPYHVQPDSENWFRLLKALRRGHNSTKTVEVMQQMPRALINERTFQLAMATCAADNLNDHVFASAGKILDLMSRTLLEPDPYTMRLYLQTAVTNHRRFTAVEDPQAREKAKFAFGRQIVRALGRLWDPLRLSVNGMTMPATPYASPADKEAQQYNARRELVALARQMVSAADMVVTEGMADEATIKDVRTSRNLLNRHITRFYEGREEREPNLRRRSGREKDVRTARRGIRTRDSPKPASG